MSNCVIKPGFATKTFVDIWKNVASFKADFAASPFATAISSTSPDNVSLLYYLLYAKYGNSHIANLDENQFKYKIYSVIFQYGPTWEKRLDIQSKLRALTEADLVAGSRAIYNAALNPSTAPSTSTLEELTYINSQNTTNYKRSKMEAYSMLWDILKTDVTSEFVNKFKSCFIPIVRPNLYCFIEDDSSDDEE